MLKRHDIHTFSNKGGGGPIHEIYGYFSFGRFRSVSNWDFVCRGSTVHAEFTEEKRHRRRSRPCNLLIYDFLTLHRSILFSGSSLLFVSSLPQYPSCPPWATKSLLVLRPSLFRVLCRKRTLLDACDIRTERLIRLLHDMSKLILAIEIHLSLVLQFIVYLSFTCSYTLQLTTT